MTEDETRESLARYFEHLSRCEFGLIKGFTDREIYDYVASWVRNRLDVKWAAEIAANTPLEPAPGFVQVAMDDDVIKLWCPVCQESLIGVPGRGPHVCPARGKAT